MENPQKIIDAAVEQLGSPYVYGTWGQLCTPALRKRYANYNPSQREITFRRCQVLRDSDPKPSCEGCKYNGMLAFDCRGFTHWCVLKAGIDIYGQKVSVQYGTDSNWDVRGDIALLPELVSCVFLEGHTGLYLLGGLVIHCSGEVKAETLGEGRKWTGFAVPKGLYTMDAIASAILAKGPEIKLTKRGDKGLTVMYLQALLNRAGCDCGLIDGKYGAKTEAAVRSLQEQAAIKADGICGPATWALLTSGDVPALDDDDDEKPDMSIGGDLSDPETPVVEDGQDYALTQEEAAELRKSLLNAIRILDNVIGDDDADESDTE